MSRQRSALRNQAEYAAYRVARAAAGRLGPRALAGVGRVLGDLLWLGGVRRSIVRFNLALAFPEWPEARRRQLARQVARHFAGMVLEGLRVQRLDRSRLLEEVTLVGLSEVAAAAELGRGVIYLAAHLGHWEVAALGIGLVRPEPLHLVTRPLDNPLLDAELARLRGRFGNLALGKTNVARPILRHLAERGAVGILIDQRVGPEVAVEVPFFGQPTRTTPVLARLVRHTRAPVVPVVAFRDRPGHYLLRFSSPVVPDRLAEPDLDDLPLTARFTAILEEMIRERPEQWLWYHDRWQHLRVTARASPTTQTAADL